jgi:hypothetical protein
MHSCRGHPPRSMTKPFGRHQNWQPETTQALSQQPSLSTRHPCRVASSVTEPCIGCQLKTGGQGTEAVKRSALVWPDRYPADPRLLVQDRSIKIWKLENPDSPASTPIANQQCAGNVSPTRRQLSLRLVVEYRVNQRSQDETRSVLQNRVCSRQLPVSLPVAVN